MKGFARKAIVCVIILSMFLSGCGTAMISLTEEEEAIIVAYASGAVAKGNRCQTQGLTYYQPEEEEPLEETPVQPEDNEPQTDTTDTPTDPNQQGQQGQDGPAINMVSLTEALGIPGVTAEYRGYQVNNRYAEGEYFAINAQEGKTYLVVTVALTNTSQQPVECNVYSKNMVGSILINGTEQIPAMTTVMLKDFLTYINTLDAGVSEEVVVLFEVPQELAGNVQTLAMQIEMNEILYQIGLE